MYICLIEKTESSLFSFSDLLCMSLFCTCVQAGSPWKIQIISESMFCLWKETSIRSSLKITEKLDSKENVWLLEILHFKNSAFGKNPKVERSISLLKWFWCSVLWFISVSQAPNRTAKEKRIVLQSPIPWCTVFSPIKNKWDMRKLGYSFPEERQCDIHNEILILKYWINPWTFRPLSQFRWKFLYEIPASYSNTQLFQSYHYKALVVYCLLSNYIHTEKLYLQACH